MYLPNALEALMEFYRVLAPGGKLFVYNPISRFPRLCSAVKKIHEKNLSGAKEHRSRCSIKLETSGKGLQDNLLFVSHFD